VKRNSEGLTCSVVLSWVLSESWGLFLFEYDTVGHEGGFLWVQQIYYNSSAKRFVTPFVDRDGFSNTGRLNKRNPGTARCQVSRTLLVFVQKRDYPLVSPTGILWSRSVAVVTIVCPGGGFLFFEPNTGRLSYNPAIALRCNV